MNTHRWTKWTDGLIDWLNPFASFVKAHMVDTEAPLTKIRALTRDINEMNAYLEATAQLVMVGIRPEQITLMARMFARAGIDVEGTPNA